MPKAKRKATILQNIGNSQSFNEVVENILKTNVKDLGYKKVEKKKKKIKTTFVYIVVSFILLNWICNCLFSDKQ